jgi:sugar-phosphatase
MQYEIFDMDGLLIDSEPLWLEVEQSTLLNEYGIELDLNQLAQFCGMNTKEFAEKIARLYPQFEINPQALCRAILKAMESRIHLAPLMPGAKELLNWLSHREIGLAIASSSPLSFIEAVVQQNQLPIDVLTSGNEVARSKPHPAVFELAACRLGAIPWQCRVWEDSINGVIAGKAAGMQVFALPDPNHAHPNKFSIADQILPNLNKSLQTLKKQALTTAIH